MTQKEFDEWLEFHCDVFPEVQIWLQGRNLDLIIEEWAKAMSRTPLDAAMNCTRKMVSGEIEHPNKFEISRLPAIVCRSCKPTGVQPLTPEQIQADKDAFQEYLQQQAKQEQARAAYLEGQRKQREHEDRVRAEFKAKYAEELAAGRPNKTSATEPT